MQVTIILEFPASYCYLARGIAQVYLLYFYKDMIDMNMYLALYYRYLCIGCKSFGFLVHMMIEKVEFPTHWALLGGLFGFPTFLEVGKCLDSRFKTLWGKRSGYPNPMIGSFRGVTFFYWKSPLFIWWKYLVVLKVAYPADWVDTYGPLINYFYTCSVIDMGHYLWGLLSAVFMYGILILTASYLQ